jgi:hypothetical protein
VNVQWLGYSVGVMNHHIDGTLNKQWMGSGTWNGIRDSWGDGTDNNDDDRRLNRRQRPAVGGLRLPKVLKNMIWQCFPSMRAGIFGIRLQVYKSMVKTKLDW